MIDCYFAPLQCEVL